MKKIKSFFKQHIWTIFFIVFILGLTVPIISPLLQPGFFPIHDNQQVARLYELDLALRAGQFPVRWVQNLGFGYGYPLFNFYPPFLYYLAEIFHLLGASYIWSIKLVFIFSFLSAAFFIYLLSRKFAGKLGGVLAAVFYLYLPYRAVDSFVRGALAELLSLSWLPALAWAGARIFYKPKIIFKDVFLLGLFTFLLMTTHNLTMLIFAPFFLLWSLLFFLKLKPNKRWPRLKLFAIGLLLGAGYSCFFWLPALWEKKHTLVDQILLKNLYDYRLHFVYLDQLWHSPFGYGGSLPGRIFDDISGMSFQIGKVHLITALFVLFITFWQLVKGKKINQVLVKLGAFVLLAVAVFMSLSFSSFIWDLVKPIQYIQFSWRFLGIIGLFVSFLGGFAVSRGTKFFKLTVFSILATLVVLTNKNYFKPSRMDYSLQDSDYINEEEVKWNVSSSSFEYLPSGIVLEEKEGGLEFKPPVTKDNISRTRLPADEKVKVLKDVPHLFVLETRFDKETEVKVNIFSFPGWKLLINNRQVTYQEDNLKLINFKVPAGENLVTLKFTNTPIRTLSNLITFFSFILSLLFLFKKDFLIKFKK